MPRPPIDLARKIKDILRHVQPLPDNAKPPILHYRRTGADIWGALAYIERAVGKGERRQAVVDRHLGRLYGMALVNLVQTFERFLKEPDAVKLRLWTKETIDAPQILAPTRSDLIYLRRFLDETANVCNRRIGERLAELLTTIDTQSPALFDAKEMADRVASIFRLPLQVAGATGVAPPD